MDNRPSFTNLFGSQDYCSNTSYSSYLSPATYLNDLLAAIQTHITPTNPSESFSSRRPDVSDIIANKENTESLINKVMLVNKVLVDYLSPSAVTYDPSVSFFLQYESYISAAKEYLEKQTYPLNVPYSSALDKVTTGIAQQGMTYIELWQQLDIPYASVAPELLNITSAQWGLITSPQTPLATLYGFNKGTSDETIVTALTSVDTFLKKTGLDFAQLEALIVGDLSCDEIKEGLEISCYIRVMGESVSSIGLSQDGKTLTNLTSACLERINRFLRLSQYLNWSIVELNYALFVANNLDFTKSDGLSNTVLPLLIWVDYYSNKTDLTIEETIGLVGIPKYFGNKEGQCLYQRIFNSPANKIDVVGGVKWDIWGVDANSEANQTIANELSSGLCITHGELLEIVAATHSDSSNVKPIPLNVYFLASYYRLSQLPRLTGLSISESMLAANLLGIQSQLADYDITVAPDAINKLVHFTDWLANQSFSVYDLQFMVTRTSDSAQVLNQMLSADTATNLIGELSLKNNQVQLKHSLAAIYDITADLAQVLIENVCTVADFKEIDLVNLIKENDAKSIPAIDILRCLQQGAEVIKCAGLSLAESKYFASCKTKGEPSIFVPSFTDGTYITLENIEAIVKFKSLVKRYSDSGNHLLNFVINFETNPAKAINELASDLSVLTQWEQNEISTLLASEDFSQLQAIECLYTLQKYFDNGDALKISATQLQQLIKLGYPDNGKKLSYESVAASIWTGVSAKPDCSITVSTMSTTKSQKTKEQLDEKLRDKLVAQALHQSGFTNTRELYGKLLIDVEVSSAVQTSVIREGITAAQLYIGRCLNQQEDCTVSSDLKKIWTWTYSYRTWYPNEEVFLFPENYIEPTLRPNKSPEFAKFEHALKQADLTKQGAIKILFGQYVESIVELANLKVVGAAVYGIKGDADEKSVDKDKYKQSKLMLIASTQKQPTRYYSRIVNLKLKINPKDGNNEAIPSEWEYWKEVDIQMHPAKDKVTDPSSGNLIAHTMGVHPVYTMGQWYLFWVEKKQIGSENNSNPTVRYYSANVMYAVQNSSGGWSAPQQLATIDTEAQPWEKVEFQAHYSAQDIDSISFDGLTPKPIPIPGADYQIKQFPSPKENFTFNLASNLHERRRDGNSSSALFGETSNEMDLTIEQVLLLQGHDDKLTPLNIQTAFPNLGPLSVMIQEAKGVDHLMSVETQETLFITNNPAEGKFSPYDPASALYQYCWELYFHIPLLVSAELTGQQQFQTAKTWLEYVFNPSIDPASASIAQGENPSDAYWSFLGLRSQYNTQLPNENTDVANLLATDLSNPTEQKLSNLDPYDPHAIANLRPEAYQKYAVLQTYRNLMAWGDQLYRENTRSNITEAEMFYVMARDILGKTPKSLVTPIQALSNLKVEAFYNNCDDPKDQTEPDKGAVFAKVNSCLLAFSPNGVWCHGSTGWKQATNSTSLKNIPSVVSSDSVAYILDGDDVYVSTVDGLLTTLPSIANSNQITALCYCSTQNCLWGAASNKGEGAPITLYKLEKNQWVASGLPVCKAGGATVGSILIDGDNVYIATGGPLFVSLSGAGWTKVAKGPGDWLFLNGRSGVSEGNIYYVDSFLKKGASEFTPIPQGFFPANWSKPCLVASFSGTLVYAFPQSDDEKINTPVVWMRKPEGQWVYLPIISEDPQSRQSIRNFVDNTFKFLELHVNKTGVTLTVQYDAPSAPAYALVNNEWVNLPSNTQILADSKTVEQRLFNIRHCLTINGQPDILKLFAKPLNPLDLEAAIADGKGVQGTANIQPIAIEMPAYRFSVMLQKAQTYTSTVIQFGQSLLSAFEQLDAEKLAMLYNTHQTDVLHMQRASKNEQINAAKANVLALISSQVSAQDRQDFYQRMISDGLSAGEKTQIVLSAYSLEALIPSLALNIMAIEGYGIPTIFGLSDGGVHPGDMIQQGAAISQTVSSMLGQGAQLAATMASFQRRSEDWGLQQQTAVSDIEALQYQIQSAQHNLSSVENDLSVLETEITQSQKVASFYKQRFTNEQLFQWYIKELSTLYSQSYNLAVEVARQAEMAWNFEQLGRQRNHALMFTQFIQPGNWNSLFQGLLSGEGLMLDLHRMEKTYDDNNERRLEIEKTFALSLHSPEALVQLKSTGTCTFDFMEADFTLDFPGHFCRQIKSISVSLPLVIGPYQNIHATLTQNKYQVVTSDGPHGQNAVDQLLGITNKDDTSLLDTTNMTGADKALISCCRAKQKIALSKGINDSGMFEMHYNDARYLPFEGTGAVSNWTLSIPKENNNIDFESLTDVIIRMEYTALPGQMSFEEHVKTQLAKIKVEGFCTLPLSGLTSWQAFNQTSVSQSKPLTIAIDPAKLRTNYHDFEIKSMSILVDLAEGVTQVSDPLTLSLVSPAKEGSVKISFTKLHTDITQGVVLEGAWSITVDKKPIINSPISVQAEGAWVLSALALPTDIQNLTLLVEYTASPIAAS
ncbi:MAG: hypothetical protein JKY93_12905 [Gammaproteobacteria bacterium]|nr:hypothetical protein [Gammaproteobacteria bacterium]